MQDLSHTCVRFNGFEDVYSGGSNAGIGVVEQGFQDRIADADILSDVRLEALEGFGADAGVLVVSKGDDEGVTDAGGLATVSGAALSGHEADGVVTDASGGGVLRGQHEEIADGGIVEGALHLPGHNLVVVNFDDLAVGLTDDAGDAGDFSGSGLTWRGLGRGLRCDGSGGAGGATLGVFVSAEDAGTGTGDQHEAGGDGRGVKDGEVVHHALAEPLIPALRRESVEGFLKAQAGARYEVSGGLDDGMRSGQHLEGQQLFALCMAVVATGHMPLQLVTLLIGQLAVRCRDDPFMCNFAIHSYVLPASKIVATFALKKSASP